MGKPLKISSYLMISLNILFLASAIALIALVTVDVREQALVEAQAKAQLIMDRNLATHRYFTHHLKPKVFEITRDFLSPGFFEPVWMSSTYALRQIQHHFLELNPEGYYYREAAIDARSPSNEADEYEKSFLNDLAANPNLPPRSAIISVDEEPFLSVMKKSEALIPACLRCHTTPQEAPVGLIEIYGPERSFERQLGQVTSVSSIRIPLSQAYSQANSLIWRMSFGTVVVLLILFILIMFVNKRYLLSPLAAIREKASLIVSDPARLGEQIDKPKGREFIELVDAFNAMSERLRQGRDNLDQEICERTQHLEQAKKELEEEVGRTKKIQKTLSESEQRFRLMFQRHSAVMLLIDPETGNIIDANLSAQKFYGYELATLCRMSIQQINTLPADEVAQERGKALLEKRNCFFFPHRLATGEVRDVEVHSSPIEFEGRKILFSIIHDITERKLAEERIRKSEEKYRILADNMEDVIWQTTPDLVFTYVSPSIKKMRGFDPSEVVGRPIWEFVSPDSVEPIKKRVAERFQSLSYDRDNFLPQAYETEHHREDGTTLWTETVTSPVFNEAGQLIAFQGITRDITERKLADEALRSSEERFRTLFQTSNDAIFLSDGLEFIECNPKALQTFGCRDEKDIAGHTSMEFSPEKQPNGVDSKEEIHKYVEAALDSGPQTFYWQHCRKDGTPFDAEVTLNGLILKGKAFLHGSVRDITESKLASEQLRKSEEKYRSLFEDSMDGIFITSTDGTLIDANQSFLGLFGYQEEEILGSSMLKCYANPEDRKLVLHDLDQKGAVKDYPLNLIKKDGTEMECLLTGSVMKAPDGSILGYRGIIRDITDFKQAERHMRESEEKFSKVFQYAPVLMTLSNMDDATYFDVNDKFCEVSGFSRTEAVGKTAVNLGWISQEDRIRLIEEMGAKGNVRGMELKLLTKDRREIHCIYNGELIQTKNRNMLISIALDITERKLVEEALHQSEERYRTVANFTYDWEYWVSPDGNLLYISPSCERITGYSPEEFIGDPDLMNRIVHPDDRSRVMEHFHLARKVDFETPHSLDFRIVRRDGETRWINHACQPVRGEAGQPLGRRSSNRDITKRKRYEFTQRRLATVIEQAAEGIIITDAAGIIQYVNPAEETITGFTRDELIGQVPSIFKSRKHDKDFYTKLWETIATRKAWSGRFVNKKKDGTEYHEDASISPVYDDSGNLTNFVAVKHDVTEHIQLQQQLLQAQKMEAVGTLAGGIAHDFNNILQIVSGYSELLLGSIEETDKRYSHVEKIITASQRGADLVQNLMMFSRKVEPNPKPMNLNDEVVQIQKLLSRTIPKDIKINAHLSGDLELVNADISQIGQVLMNLAVNARDAMPEGGTLNIETKSVWLDRDYCAIHPDLKPGIYVLLEVADTGIGMDEETVSHIFEPFFTTKDVGKGTGLGLATVYGIVRQHNGHVTCHSKVGKGTVFKIYLPVVEQKLESDAQEGKNPIAGGTETILLVDDEEHVRDLGAIMLNRYGYEVLTAGNGKEALDIYRTNHEKISLVILDLVMPEMDGKKCLAELLNINPKANVLIASGHFEGILAMESSFPGAKGLVAKPYQMKKLLQAVREVLDAEG